MFYRPSSLWSWTLLAAIVIETFTVLICESVIFSIFQISLRPGLFANPEIKAIPTFLTLLIFGFLYQAILFYDTVAQRNTIQLGGLCIYAATLFTYTVFQYQQIRAAIDVLVTDKSIDLGPKFVANIRSLSIVNATMTGLYTSMIIFLSFKLYTEFQWTIYRQLNADLKMQRRYFTFKIYVAMLKFDLFFFLGFIIQFAVISTGPEDAEFILTITAIPTIIVTLMASTWFMRRESKVGMLVVLVLHVALLAFFIFKILRLYQHSHERDYLPARRNIGSFGIATIILSAITIGVAIKCMTNFNTGLKAHVTSHRLAQRLLEDHEMELSEFNMRI